MSDLSALHDIALFVEIARTGSFRKAGQSLGVSTATLSRRLAAMELRFDTLLFNRTTRRVDLTDAGRRYFDRCEHLADEARLAQEALREASHRPSGHLRVSMPADLGLHYIGPLLPEFARLNPGVSFELDLSPQARELVAGRFDVAIRLGAVRGEGIASRRIGWIEQGLFAAPGYLELRGRPGQPGDLAEHDCIAAASESGPARWRLVFEQKTHTVTVRGRFSANNQGLMRSLAERGFGIAALAPALWRDALGAGLLLPVLPDWTMRRLHVNAATAARTPHACARAFIDFLADRFAAA
ncbi:MAG TPA: LysR family transcriptional regulator [Ideonella sp.]|nr:LysR family transcriptional regulator [Ideonella sp.]